MEYETAEKAAELGVPIISGAVTGTAKAILNDKVAVAEVVGIWAGYAILKEIVKQMAEKTPAAAVAFLSFIVSKFSKKENTNPI